MIVIVLDASAVAKWFIREQGSLEMKVIRDKIVASELEGYAPEFILVEIANLLRYSKGISAEDARNAIKSLEIILHLRRDRDLLQKAIKLAFEEKITVYDSLYVALAAELGTRLVTYDKELLNKFGNTAITAEELLR